MLVTLTLVLKATHKSIEWASHFIDNGIPDLKCISLTLFCSETLLLWWNLDCTANGHCTSVFFHYDPSFLGCVTSDGLRCVTFEADRVVAFVEDQSISVFLNRHLEGQRTRGILEQLKIKF